MKSSDLLTVIPQRDDHFPERKKHRDKTWVGRKFIRPRMCSENALIEKFINDDAISRLSGPWSRGYDVALTWRRSPVQIRPGPPSFLFDHSSDSFCVAFVVDFLYTKNIRQMSNIEIHLCSLMYI